MSAIIREEQGLSFDVAPVPAYPIRPTLRKVDFYVSAEPIVVVFVVVFVVTSESVNFRLSTKEVSAAPIVVKVSRDCPEF